VECDARLRGAGRVRVSLVPRHAAPAALFSPQTNGTFDSNDERFACNAATGALYYGPNGSAAGSPRELVATLTEHPTLTATDLFYVG
jgi:hypothetical protein